MAVPLFAGNAAAGDPANVGGKKNGPPPPDFMGFMQQQADASQRLTSDQTQANRPNQSTPFASSQWTQGPDGQWSQSVGFNGPLAQANSSLQQQAADALRQPFDLSGIPGLSSGEEARDQAINAAYGQATSRLDPQWQQREDQTRARLLASGLQEGSAAYNRAFENLGRERNDAYNQAQFSAIGQGTQAGNALFNQSLARRQQNVGEYQAQRGSALSDLLRMQGLTQMPGFAQVGRAETPQFLQAGGMQDAAAQQRWQQQMQMISDLIGMGGQLGGAAMMASDERLKENIERYGFDAIQGVPAASWDWIPGSGMPDGRQYGVIAQDLQQVRPDLVHAGDDGMLMVDYRGLLGGE